MRILPDYLKSALHLEREAVCALTYGGVCLVRADFDLVEGAIVLAAAVVLTVLDSTADVLVCKFSSHFYSSFLFCKTIPFFRLHCVQIF